MTGRNELGQARIGIIGLGPMGRNLALNFRDKNIRVAVFDTFAEVRSNFPKQAGTQDIPVCSDFADLVSRLAAPRIVLLMVKAGEPVDAAIATLARHLTEGDIIVDGGNSFWQDTERRETELAAKGIRFVGAGISGGEEGARHGPSIMVGGAKEAWASLQPLLQAIAAKSGSIACCDWVGPGGAGHFVKMMHNGVEYAVMQMLGEAWILMRDAAGLSPVRAAKEFSRWNDGPMGSFLIEITAEILSHTDDLTGRPLIEMIADNAGQKGTGGWSVTAALDLGVSAPSIAEAVMARALSGAKGDRALAQQALSQHHASGSNVNLALDDLEQAYGAAAIVAYAQGFAVIEAAARRHGWPWSRDGIAALWREGCILRAKLLEWIEPGDGLLMASPAIASRMRDALPHWRRVVSAAAMAGIPVPALASALNWIEAMASPNLWTALVQGQRDRFGAHGFERIDRPGQFHGAWPAVNGRGATGV